MKQLAGINEAKRTPKEIGSKILKKVYPHIKQEFKRLGWSDKEIYDALEEFRKQLSAKILEDF